MPSDERQQAVSELPRDFYERIKDRLRERIARELSFARRVLDVGCGSCELAGFLAEKNGRRVIGVDIADHGFPDGSRLAQGVECHKADARKLGFVQDGTLDAVVSLYALHEMERPVEVLREAHRVLRHGGEILVVDFPKHSLAERLWHENYYTANEVTGMLGEAGFPDAECRGIAQGQLMWARGLKQSKGKDGS